MIWTDTQKLLLNNFSAFPLELFFNRHINDRTTFIRQSALAHFQKESKNYCIHLGLTYFGTLNETTQI
jgi:hypothetical protein